MKVKAKYRAQKGKVLIKIRCNILASKTITEIGCETKAEVLSWAKSTDGWTDGRAGVVVREEKGLNSVGWCVWSCSAQWVTPQNEYE